MLEINNLQAVEMVSVLPENRNVKRKRGRPTKNADVRTREYLEPAEVDQLRQAVRRGASRYPDRDDAMILLAARHGLRVSELVSIRWEQIKLKETRFHVIRAKGGKSGVHPMENDEVCLLRRLLQNARNAARAATGNPDSHSPYVFPSERGGGRMSPSNFQKMIEKTGREAGISFPVHPHQLRHACGFEKINNGWELLTLRDWLGHIKASSTEIYLQLNGRAFDNHFVNGRMVRQQR